MDRQLEQTQKNKLLRKLLPFLAARGVARNWATSQQPFSDLLEECHTLASDNTSLETLRTYLQTNPIIQQTVETLLSHLAMAANVKWQDVPTLVQPLARRGWHIGRWLPTFLIVDGPLGRFIKNPDSPLNLILRKEYANYPTLAQVRDIFNHELFRLVRNGVGHWSFLWEEQSSDPHLVMIDWESGKPTTTISLLEGEALHLVAFSVIEALDREVMSYANPRQNA
jgi:hypothetical protein